MPVRALPANLCRWRGPADGCAALTFDDGPSPETTPLVLDRLDELDLVATFFCLGSLVEVNPDLVGELLRRGHQVEVHGHRHEHHFLHTPWWVRADLDAAVDALTAAGASPRWFRPPFGQTTGGTMLAARHHRLGLALWSAWGREWAEPDAIAVARRVCRRLTAGTIVLLHDTDMYSASGSCRRVIDALGPIASYLDENGLKAVTLERLVGAESSVG
jgi:peptidoglycan/xylan/chitin deacetylase (PgdA/CDA1 family)